jgi:phosphoribosylcarboxyaminoimidazole (NCAIR) mutase
MNKELVAQLTKTYELALAASRAHRTPETMNAAVKAGEELSYAIVSAGLLPKIRGYSTRAGKRQQAEQMARTAENMRRKNAW